MSNDDMIYDMYVDVIVIVYRCMILTSHLAVMTDTRSSEKYHTIYIIVNIFFTISTDTDAYVNTNIDYYVRANI